MAIFMSILCGIVLFLQSPFIPLLYDVPKGAIDYGGGFDARAEIVLENPLAFFENGGTDYCIVLPDGEVPPTFNTGAGWIVEFVGMMTGVTLEVKRVAQLAPGEKYIALGYTGLDGGGLDAELAELETNEGFVKKVIGENIFITGLMTGKATDRGTMYGCSSFIEEQLGCRWFEPGKKTAPAKSSIQIDRKLCDVQNVFFDYRDAYYATIVENPEFKAFHKLNSFMHNGMPAEYGNCVDYIGFCHTLEWLVPAALYDENPNLFSYRKDEGRRTTSQRCLSNPEVLEVTMGNVRNWINYYGRAGGIEAHNIIVSITQLDNDGYCQCPACEALDEKYGGPSGTNIWFTNQCARLIAAEYPDKDILVDTFAYTYTVEAPTVVDPSGDNVPDENVIVRVCTMGCCFNHPLRECGRTRNDINIVSTLFANMTPKASEFTRIMGDWDALCRMKGAQMYVWNYNTNFKFNPTIYPNLHVISDNLRFFYENSVRGVYEQGFDSWGQNPGSGKNGEFVEMRAYIAAKCLWNPYVNVNQVMAEFMAGYYGAGAPYVKEFLDFYTRRAIATCHINLFARPEKNPYLSPAEARRMDCLFDKAEQAAKGDAYQLTNVMRTRLCLRFYKANMMICEYSLLNPLRILYSKKLFEDSVMLGLDRYTDVMYVPEGYAWLYRPFDWARPNSWIQSFDADSAVFLDSVELESWRAERVGEWKLPFGGDKLWVQS